jgi:pseudaminic acid biosynthesis-associated methylase
METEQETFWKGNNFGSRYINDNESTTLFNSKLNLYKNILQKTDKIYSVLEFGCNIGLNLDCFKSIDNNINVTGVELFEDACNILKEKQYNYHNKSIFDFESSDKFDLVLSAGLMIHLNPDKIKEAYVKLYNHSSKYIIIAEYYNPKPVMVEYRGEINKLFKRDFAGEMLDIYKDLELIDYGFVYHRDNKYPLDDINWFLLKKN